VNAFTAASTTAAAVGSEEPLSPGYDAATRDDAEFNTKFQETPLTIPVRMITQAGLAEMVLPPLQDAAPHATSADVPGAGHFLLHEAPDRVLAEINAFYPAPAA
jgi:pimeloyl-ACP methyl ester carboxylesterase